MVLKNVHKLYVQSVEGEYHEKAVELLKQAQGEYRTICLKIISYRISFSHWMKIILRNCSIFLIFLIIVLQATSKINIIAHVCVCF